MFRQEDQEQNEQEEHEAIQLAADLADASLDSKVSLIFSSLELQFISFFLFFFSNRSSNQRMQT